MSSKKSLQDSATDYLTMSDDEKTEFLTQFYTTEQCSFPEIATAAGTYSNKLRRDAKRLGVAIRSQSDAQSLALKQGKRKHPTEGKARNEADKIKISEALATSWKNLAPSERQRRADIVRKQWDNMSDDDKANFHHKAMDAVRVASKEGSKLEKYILAELLAAGFRTEFHKEHLIVNERLQLDLFLPKINVAIEVDGPSHFSPIWGAKTLERNQRADKEKAGLLLSKGLVFVRVIQDKPLSQKYQRDIVNALVAKLNEIVVKFPERQDRYIEISA